MKWSLPPSATNSVCYSRKKRKKDLPQSCRERRGLRELFLTLCELCVLCGSAVIFSFREKDTSLEA